jgi:hypothetical protein
MLPAPLLSHSNLIASPLLRYVQYGRITVKLDAYALGKVLLELLTGRTHAEDLGRLVKSGLATTMSADGDSAQQFQAVLDPKIGSWTSAEVQGARELAKIALELTALDEAARLSVAEALPKLLVL